jgi:hypothetical protein
MEGRLEVVLPERDLAVQAPDRHSPILLRIAFTRPHGTLTHYDLRYVGQVPGEYDLRNHLFLTNGQPATNLQPILVTISGILPTPHHGWLEEQALRSPSLFGGYRGWMIAAAVLWALSLIPIARLGPKSKPDTLPQPAAQEPTFAERIRPLVERAVTGRLSVDEKAALERMLITYWQRRLGLAEADGEQLISKLREHPEAGALLRALEDWLHRPPGHPTVPVREVESILAPYRHPPAGEPHATSPA